MTGSHVVKPPDATPRKTAANKPTKKAPAKKTTTPRKPPRPAPVHPWDQQPDETDAAHNAFLVYRALGRTRSINAVEREWGRVGAELGLSPKCPSRTSIDKWATANSWRHRPRRCTASACMP